MSRNITVGIDIGTYQVKVVVAEYLEENNRNIPRIIGAGQADSKGLRHGYVTNIEDVTASVSEAVQNAEKAAGIRIRKAYISLGGIGLGSTIAQGGIVISRADLEVCDLDIQKVQEACEKEISGTVLLNRKIIHAIPLQYKLDGKTILGKPTGMKGVKLEARTLFITCQETHLKDFIEAVEGAGVEVLDVMTSPLAASFVTLSKSQKVAGCVLANIGAETTSIVVFENNIPISLEVFPIGGTDITNDIALGLKVSLDEAEHVKLGGVTTTIYPRKKLEEIIYARLSDIFELIQSHLKKLGRNELLPAGIIITGGSAGIPNIEESAKEALSIPSRIALLQIAGESGKGTTKDSSWAVAYGLCIFGFTAGDNSSQGFKKFTVQTKNKIFSLIKQFLP